MKRTVMLAALLAASPAWAIQSQTTVDTSSLVLQAEAGRYESTVFLWSGVFDGGRQAFRGTETIYAQPTVAPALVDCRPRGVRIPPSRVTQVTRWRCLYRFAGKDAWSGPYDIDTPDGLK